MSLTTWEPLISPTLTSWDRLFGAMDTMPVDLEEKDGSYVLTASLPGFRPEDVDISTTGNVVSIRAFNAADDEKKKADGRVIMRERSTRHVARTIRLPVGVNAEAATARYENGELVLTLPKDYHRIQIEAGDNSTSPAN